MMIPERPSLERRVLTALEGAASGGPRIPVVLGGCGTGRTSLLLRVRDLLGRNACQYIDVERVAPRSRLAQVARDLLDPGCRRAARGGADHRHDLMPRPRGGGGARGRHVSVSGRAARG